MDHYRQTHTAVLHGSSRASLVRTLPKSVYKLTKVVDHEPDLYKRPTAVQSILSNARGDRVCVHHGPFWDVHKEQTRLFFPDSGVERDLAFSGDGVLAGQMGHQDGDSRARYVLPTLVLEWLSALPASPYIVYVAHFRYVPPTPHGEVPESQEALGVGASLLVRDAQGESHWEALYDEYFREHRFPGRGTGAIGEDLRAVLAMTDGRLLVFEGLTGKSRLETKLPYPITDLSLPGDDYALVSTTAETSTLHRLGPDAKEKWSVKLDFPLSQPPVDGGNGTLYLAGAGLAAVRDGKVLFSRKSKDTLRMTCFEDGTCAIAEGRTLRLTTSQGHTLHTFTTPEGEPIVVPPAIGGDGSIWLATEKAVYAAR